MLVHVDDERLGPLLQHNVLFRLSATPGAIRFPGRGPGADTDEVLVDDLGLSPERLRELRDSGAVA